MYAQRFDIEELLRKSESGDLTQEEIDMIDAAELNYKTGKPVIVNGKIIRKTEFD